MIKSLKESEKDKSDLLDSKEEDTINMAEYSDDENDYISGLQSRLEQSQIQRDRKHDEFDGMTLAQFCDSNEKAANTYVPPKKNPEDSLFVSGTIRQKLFTYLAYANNLDLSPSISAYDSKDLEIRGMGLAMEDIVRKTEELDEDDEKKMLRQYEMLKQGTVFVEDIWEDKWGYDKKMTSSFNGKINSAKWDKRLKKVFSGATRNIIPMENVYLGSMTTYELKKQPYLFTVNYISYSEAKRIYGNWERWANVPKKVVTMVKNPTGEASAGPRGFGMVYNNWRLTDQVEDLVEEIKYQDKPNNEFGIILNGVLMTPIGLPFPWNYNEYSIVQQNFEPIHKFFPYGNSFIRRVRNNVELLDEFMRMAVLKTQKSFSPARFNLTGRVLSSKIFMPGKMNYGINPAELPMDPHDSSGMTNPELEMIRELQTNIDKNSVSPTFQGQGSGGATATEILDMQRQARMVMGISMFSLSMLEWKLSWLRLYNILNNWFDPIDTQVDDFRNKIVNVYRTVNAPAAIKGEGMGKRLTVISDESYTPAQIYKAEQDLAESTGTPSRITVLDPSVVTSAKNTWQIVIIPREKKSNEISKLMFRGMLADIQMFGSSINMSYLQEEFAEVWDRDPSKLFNPQQQAPTPTPPTQKEVPGSKSAVANVPGLPAGQSVGNPIQ